MYQQKKKIMQKKKLLFVLLLIYCGFLKAQNTFTLTSNNLGGQSSQKEEFNGFGCEGENTSPQLSWANPPEGTESFAISMFDPDAPTGSGWWHWVVFNIPKHMNKLETNSGNIDLNLMPKEVIQSINDYGFKGFGGPCPPTDHGYHEYKISIFALKTKSLNLDENTNPTVVGYNIWLNTIAKASLVFYYKRDKK